MYGVRLAPWRCRAGFAINCSAALAWRDRPSLLEEPTSPPIEELGVAALLTVAARFRSWLDVEAARPGAG
jgi:hypothetical protein